NRSRVGASGWVGNVFVLVEVFLRRLIRRVWRIEGQIKKERFSRVLLVDESEGVVSQQRGRIAFLHHLLVIPEPVDDTFRLVREVIDLADERAVLVVEAALSWPIFVVGVAKVPLTDDRGGVAGLLQRLWQEPFVGRQTVLGTGRDDSRLQSVSEG